MGEWRITVSGKCLGQILQNVFYLDGGEGQWVHSTINAYVVQWYCQILKPVQQTSFSWETVEVRNRGDGPQNVSLFTIGPIFGTGSGNGIANPMAFIIQKRTGLTGRNNRGRLYIPGPLANHTSNGVINAAGVAAYANILATFNSQFATAPSDSKLRMRVVGHGPNAGDAVVTHFLLAPTMGVQRRRNVNVGI